MHKLLHDTVFAQKHTEFEQEYLSLREKEGRIYSDELVAQLPFISNTHCLKDEWKIRGRSCKRLANYFSKQNKSLRILEIGCGNGWLSNQLSTIPNAHVMGMDINTIELEQAKRLFTKVNLHFIYGDIREVRFTEKFDAIVFAASFQYFTPVVETLSACFDALKDTGEIHIIDSPFYSEIECSQAKERSKKYFDSNAAPAMTSYYFHHSFEDLASYRYTLLFNPKSFVNKIFKINPFPWICITK